MPCNGFRLEIIIWALLRQPHSHFSLFPVVASLLYTTAMSEQEQERENQSIPDNSGKIGEKSALNTSKTSSNSNDLSQTREKKKSITSSEGKDSESDDLETHLSAERERRKKIRNMFGSLHALLPHLPFKADKATIVDEAVNYIKTLEQTLQKLQKQKLERLQSVSNFGYSCGNSREAFIADQVSSSLATSNPSIPHCPIGFHTWVSSNVVLNICGEEAQFSVCSPKNQCLFSTICFVLEKHKIEVLSAHISSDNNRSLYMIQAHANRDSDQFPETFSAEETFKQAAEEIILWLS